MIWGIRSTRILFEHGFESGVILIDGEKIAAFQSSVPEETKVVDVGDFVVMAGLVDTHVDINGPGRTEWEGFKTATQAALAGGITTVVDMPLNCTPVTTSAAAFKEKRVDLGQQNHVDLGFWGGVVTGNKPDLDGAIVGVAGGSTLLRGSL